MALGVSGLAKRSGMWARLAAVLLVVCMVGGMISFVAPSGRLHRAAHAFLVHDYLVDAPRYNLMGLHPAADINTRVITRPHSHT